MQNLNKVKGNASKMEALMRNYKPRRNVNHRNLTRELSNSSSDSQSSSITGDDVDAKSSDDNDDVVTVFQCNCQNEHNHDNELDDNARVPTIDDFIKEIKCSGILADAEKSRQLLLLIQMYFQVQDLNVNSSTENVSEGSENYIKLPPL